MNLAKQFLVSVYSFHEYPRLLYVKGIKVFIYFLLFTLIITVFQFGPMAYSYINAGKAHGIVKNYVPDFKIENGKFQCESVSISDSGVKIYINTDEEFNIDAMAKGASIYFIADSNNYAFSDGVNVTKGTFSDIESFSKDDLLLITENGALIDTVLIITIIISALISAVFALAILICLISIVNGFTTKTPLKFSHKLKLAVYVRTFPVLLKILIAYMGISVGILIYGGVTIAYIYFGLKNIKAGSGTIIASL